MKDSGSEVVGIYDTIVSAFENIRFDVTVFRKSVCLGGHRRNSISPETSCDRLPTVIKLWEIDCIHVFKSELKPFFLL